MTKHSKKTTKSQELSGTESATIERMKGGKGAKKTKRVVREAKARKGSAKAEVLELTAPATPEPEAKPEPKGASVVRAFYKTKYKAQGGNNTDAIAKALTNLWLASPDAQLEAYRDACSENGIDPARWMHLNSGMRRMNLANVLRGMVRNETPVTIGGKTFRSY